MPNTLAHIAINIPLTRLGLEQLETKWILLGVILPDIPWILQKILTSLISDINIYNLRLYTIIQASFFFSLIPAFAASLLSRRILFTFLGLAAGSLIHLLSDAAEIKWGNGVHLLAPLDWNLFSIGLFWPENFIIYLLSFIGIVIIFQQLRNRREFIRLSISVKRIALVLILLFLYFTLPFLFFEEVKSSDSHFVKTLTETSRKGRYFELDRAQVVNNKKRDYIYTFANERLYLNNIDFPNSGTISVRASFETENRIRIIDYYQHDPGVRNILAVSGLALIFIYWGVLLYRGFKSQDFLRAKP